MQLLLAPHLLSVQKVSGVHSANSLQLEASVGAPAQGPRSPSSAPGREFLTGWRAGTNRRRATRSILVGKPGGRRPKTSRSTFPLGPSRKEAPLPGTRRPETCLRIEAPGSSAPSPSRPPLACCSSPLTRLLPLPPRRLPLPLCSWGREAATAPTHPQPAEVTGPPRQCLRRELVPPSPNHGKRENLRQQATGSCAGSQAQLFQGFRGLDPCCSLRGQRRVRLKELAKLAPLPPLLGEEQECPVGVVLTQKRHLTTGLAGAQAAHQATYQRHFHRPIQPWGGGAWERGGMLEEDAFFSGNKNSNFLRLSSLLLSTLPF